MRIRRTERIPIYDVAFLLDAVPALHDEWQGLQFEGSVLQNRLTGEPESWLALLSGRHRTVGAVYRIHSSTRRFELPEDRVAEFEQEAARLRERGAKVEKWERHHARRRAASELIVEPTQTDVELLRDGLGELAGRVGLDNETWNVDIEVRPDHAPHVDVEGKLDISEFIRQLSDGTTNGCALYFIGGKGKGDATIRTEAIRQGGRLLEGKGKANRFRASVDVDLRPLADEWEVDVDLRLGARGLGRLIPLFFGRRIENHINEGLESAFGALRREHEQVMEPLDAYRRVVEVNGGMREMVRAGLWDPDAAPLIPDELANDPAIRRLLDLDDLDPPVSG